jgi:hypothetical protein
LIAKSTTYIQSTQQLAIRLVPNFGLRANDFVISVLPAMDGAILSFLAVLSPMFDCPRQHTAR